jgi:hypothetical protein
MLFRVRCCPGASDCSDASFKRAGFWSYVSEEKALDKLRHHLTNSVLHNLSVDEADALISESQIEFDCEVETEADREAYRAHLEAIEQRKVDKEKYAAEVVAKAKAAKGQGKYGQKIKNAPTPEVLSAIQALQADITELRRLPTIGAPRAVRDRSRSPVREPRRPSSSPPPAPATGSGSRAMVRYQKPIGAPDGNYILSSTSRKPKSSSIVASEASSLRNKCKSCRSRQRQRWLRL